MLNFLTLFQLSSPHTHAHVYEFLVKKNTNPVEWNWGSSVALSYISERLKDLPLAY